MSEIKKINVNGTKYDIAGGEVVANPELSGDEPDLTGLQVGGTKYKVPQGSGLEYVELEFSTSSTPISISITQAQVTALQNGAFIKATNTNFSETYLLLPWNNTTYSSVVHSVSRSGIVANFYLQCDIDFENLTATFNMYNAKSVFNPIWN